MADLTTPLPRGTKIAKEDELDGAQRQRIAVAKSLSDAAFYASKEGGRVAFSAWTGFVALPQGAGEVMLAAFRNPAGSGVDVHLTWGEFGAGMVTRFRRYGGSSTLSGLGTKRAVGNRGGGTAVAKAELYAGGQFTAGNLTDANSRKGAYIDPKQYKLPLDAIMRPGSHLIWTMDNDSNQPSSGLVHLEWHELPAAS
jgi:hypothetical protein